MELPMRPIQRLLFLISAASALCLGQRLDPVQWTLATPISAAPSGATVPLHLTATLQDGWHLYSLTTPKGGPIQTTANLAESPVFKAAKLYQPAPVRKFDPNFKIDTETFEKQVDFTVAAEVSKDAEPGAAEVSIQVRYQACTDRQCLPPRKKIAS